MTTDAAERLIEFPALKEAQGALDAKRKALADILAEAGPDYDMSKVKSISGDTHAKVAEIGKLNDEIVERKSKVDELLVVARAAAISAQQERAAEKGAESGERRGAPGAPVKAGERKSFGRHFADSVAFKQFQRGSGMGPQAHIEVGLKDLMSTAAGWEPETTRTGRVEMFPTRPAPQVADLIPQTTTNQAAVVYMEEVTFNNTAAETAEGGQYPEAALELEEKTSPVRKIPVFLPVTDELFEDEPRAESYVNNRLPFMIRQRLDRQILVGDGTSPNLTGTANVTGIQTQAKGGDPAPDALYKAFRKIRDTGYAEPSVVFMTPADWEPIRLMKTADGVYIWGHPSMVGPATIWGVPVVETTAATTGTALTGDYANFCELAVRRGIDVQVSNSHSDYFVRGKLALRADLRIALIHYRPLAFCEVTGLSS